MGRLNEVFPNSKLNKNVFVFVKSGQSSIHCFETLSGVHGKLRKVEKIEWTPHNTGVLMTEHLEHLEELDPP